MTRLPRVSAMVMTLWLLAIALAAPVHELSHVSDEVTVSDQCDFFAHQSQLQQLFSHDLAALAPVSPFRWQSLSLPIAAQLTPFYRDGARGPPADPRV
ncbi:hypothetical protein KUV89_13735 [Marinobacter hydrocarbonoclasticus]|nr:hypothetical protein [Marinobacter nauticus]